MHGTLLKWTNYYNGWQPRWFLLQDGILSYYKNEEEKMSGSKGSINLSVCDINVCNFDPLKFEIVIPGEQKYFLKAVDTQERQRWIVAIGSGKACCNNDSNFIMTKSRKLSNSTNSTVINDNMDPNLILLSEEIIAKESEMRIFFNLINKNILLIKSTLDENKVPNIEIINEASSTLNAACDTFSDSLKELMTLTANRNSKQFAQSVKSLIINERNRSNYSISNMETESIELDSRCSPIPYSPDRITRRVGNFFFNLNFSFIDLIASQTHNNNSLNTSLFIKCCYDMLSFMDQFSIASFNSLKSDMESYLIRLNLRHETDVNGSITIEQLFHSENQHQCNNNGEPHVQSVIYTMRQLNRFLMFSSKLIMLFHQNLHRLVLGGASNCDEIQSECVNRTSESDDIVRSVITDAYESVIKDKLTWIDRGLFAVVLKSLPTPAKLMSVLLCQPNPPTIQNNYVTWQQYLTSNEAECYKYHQLLLDMNKYQVALSNVTNQISLLLTDVAKVEL